MIHYLSLAEIAQRTGAAFSKVKSEYQRGLLPRHDAEVGRNRGWLPETIDSGNASPKGIVRYLTVTEIAARKGYTLNTIKSYIRKNLLPDHDAEVGRNRGWLPETIDDDWIRPGRGARTDLPPLPQ